MWSTHCFLFLLRSTQSFTVGKHTFQDQTPPAFPFLMMAWLLLHVEVRKKKKTPQAAVAQIEVAFIDSTASGFWVRCLITDAEWFFFFFFLSREVACLFLSVQINRDHQQQNMEDSQEIYKQKHVSLSLVCDLLRKFLTQRQTGITLCKSPSLNIFL